MRSRLGYLVKAGKEYLSNFDCEDIWTEHQSEAYRFRLADMAEDCAIAWKYGQGNKNKSNARVVALVSRKES